MIRVEEEGEPREPRYAAEEGVPILASCIIAGPLADTNDPARHPPCYVMHLLCLHRAGMLVTMVWSRSK